MSHHLSPQVHLCLAGGEGGGVGRAPEQHGLLGNTGGGGAYTLGAADELGGARRRGEVDLGGGVRDGGWLGGLDGERVEAERDDHSSSHLLMCSSSVYSPSSFSCDGPVKMIIYFICQTGLKLVLRPFCCSIVT